MKKEFRSRNEGVLTDLSLEMVLVLMLKYKSVLTRSIFRKKNVAFLTLKEVNWLEVAFFVGSFPEYVFFYFYRKT